MCPSQLHPHPLLKAYLHIHRSAFGVFYVNTLKNKDPLPKILQALLASSVRFAFAAHRNIRDFATLTILIDDVKMARISAIVAEFFSVFFSPSGQIPELLFKSWGGMTVTPTGTPATCGPQVRAVEQTVE
jgi:hypothetical protein